jgi:hypothetical protein
MLLSTLTERGEKREWRCSLEWPTEREEFRANLDELPLRDNCEGSRRKTALTGHNAISIGIGGSWSIAS